MRTLLATLHVRRSAQAVALAAGNLKANLSKELQRQTVLLDLYPEQTLAELEEQLLAHRPQLIAFPLYLWNRRQILQLCRRLRNKQPDILLFAGGPEASTTASSVMSEGQLDGVFCGEGEQAFASLLAAVSNGESFTGIPGLQTASDRSVPICDPATCADLSTLSSPWLTGTLPITAGAGVLWEVARGCTFNCAFCYDAKGHRGVRPLPIDRLKAELQLFAAREVAQAWVLDSTFNAPATRGKQLLKLMIELAPQIHYHLEAKADFLDQETAELLSQLSCSVQIGLQSAEPDVLTPLHRSLQPEKMIRALQQLSTAGVTFGLDLIYGLPGDSHQGFRSSLNFALNQQPNQVDIFPLAVLPGTELFAQQKEFGLSAEQQPPYLVEKNHSYSAEDLEQSRQLAAATDIFYNRGRAVGFFLQFCDAASLQPVELLEKFNLWLKQQETPPDEAIITAENLQPDDILALQQKFIAELFRSAGKSNLCPLAQDLINYHFCCAELLLASECLPLDQQPAKKLLLRQKWRQNPSVRVQKFNYDLTELEEIGGEKLSRQIKQLTNEGSYAIFLRQQGQPIIEVLENNFAQLLLQADGQQKTPQLLAGFDRQTGLELLQFAVAQRLLLPAN